MRSTRLDVLEETNSWFGTFKLFSFLFAFIYIYLTQIVPKQIKKAKSQKGTEKRADYEKELAIGEEGAFVGLDPNLFETVTKYPDWLDVDKLKKGQEFARKYYGVLNFVNYISMIILLAHKKSTQTLITTKKQNTVETSGKRWLATIHHVRNWYDYDLLDFKSKAFKSVRIVNKYHLIISKMMNSKSNEQAEIDTQKILDNVDIIDDNYRQLINAAFVKTEAGLETIDMKKLDSGPHLNQNQMIGTQWSFVGLISKYPEKFGMKKDEELDAFIYLWRYIGYLMGVKDEYNICSDNYDKKFTAIHEFVYKPIFRNADTHWEHLCATMTRGLNNYLYLFPSETVLCWLLNILELNYVDFYNKLSLLEKMRLIFINFMFRHQSFAPFRMFSNVYLRFVLNRFGTMMRNEGDKSLVL